MRVPHTLLSAGGREETEKMHKMFFCEGCCLYIIWCVYVCVYVYVYVYV